MATKQWHKAYREKYRYKYKEYYRKPRAIAIKSYNGMKSRVAGKGNKKHLYAGLSLLSRQEYLNWILNNSEFHKLYCNWADSGYILQLRPSINRIDNKKGYTLDNMEIITFSENCILGNKSKKGTKYKQNKEK